MRHIATNRSAGVALLVLTALFGVVTWYLAFGLGNAGLDAFTLKWLYHTLVVAAGVLTMARALSAGSERLAWLLLGLAVALWGLGDAYWTLLLLPADSPPYPSIADVFWLAFYPPAYVGLVLLLRMRLAEFRGSLWLDGVIAALALAALGSALVFDAVLEVTGGSRPAAVATNLAYPLADLLLLGLVVATLAASGWRPDRAWGMIAAALALFAVSDVAYLYQTSSGLYVAGTLVDWGWLAAGVLIAWAAWQPRRPVVRTRLRGAWMIAPPIVFALIGLALLVYDHFARINALALALAAVSIVAILVRLGTTLGENVRLLRGARHEARTDALTGLGNRRRLVDDLADALEQQREQILALFDLNGFKQYNDSFGHPAGDALLARLGRNLRLAVRGHGRAYRMGGDEFCVLVDRAHAKLVDAAATALSEHGVGFAVDASAGSVAVPDEARTFSDALRLADERLYLRKHEALRGSAGEQSRSVLMQALSERHPDLGAHVRGVADLAERVGRRLGLQGADLADLRAAAALHDIGKLAIPDAILDKPGPLDGEEWEFVRRHPLVGERILRAAPALAGAAALVRATHERVDGKGYPDGVAGHEIPLGARIIAVCDAFHAMVSERPHSAERSVDCALAELTRAAGTQFDPRAVAALSAVVGEGRALPLAS